MKAMAGVRLRDQRKPGHGWFDNEIYDVFGDELQQNGISVYMTLARLCYGVSVTMSLREMASHARMSKDTFARSLKRVVAVGLVIEHKGATAQSASTYELVDVKELAVQYLRDVVQKNKARTVSVRDSGKNVTLIDLLKSRAVKDVREAGLADDASCLAVRQAGEDAAGEDKKFCVPQGETEVSQRGPRFETKVSQDARHVKQDTKLNTQDKTSPLSPSRAKGNDDDAYQPLEAVSKVMRECNLSDPRLARVVLAAIKLERGKCDAAEGWNSIAERMIARQRSYVDYAGKGHLRFTVRMRRFFGEGLWRDDELWAIDWQRIREEVRSRTGVLSQAL